MKIEADVQVQAGDADLVVQAQAGDESAFNELWVRHGAATWALAWAVSADVGRARAVTCEAFARSFVALRAGRSAQVPFATLVANQAVNASADLELDDLAPIASAATAPATQAFAHLPSIWRAALWLRDGAGHDSAHTAALLGMGVPETDLLVERARAGWRERYLRGHVAATGNRNCSRAVARLNALDARALPPRDVDHLERHLRLCEPCTERQAALQGLTGQLRSMAPVLPALLVDDVQAAWSAAVTKTARRTGLSGRTEKVLAGATAMAAALGVVGAAVIGSGNDDDAAAELAGRAIAPIVTDVSSPLPVNLAAAIDLPTATAGARSDGITNAAVRGLQGAGQRAVPVTGGLDAPALPVAGSPAPRGDRPISGPGGTDDDGDINSEGPGGPGVLPEGSVPTVSISKTVADVPVAVEVSDDPGVSVGPVSVGSTPKSASDDGVAVGGPLAPAAPAVEAVTTPLGL